jgi:hypothetical protein
MKTELTLTHFLHSGVKEVKGHGQDLSYRGPRLSEKPWQDMSAAMTKMIQCTYTVGDTVDVTHGGDDWMEGTVVKVGRTRITVEFKDAGEVGVYNAIALRPKDMSKMRVSNKYYEQETSHECPFCHTTTQIHINGWDPRTLRPWYTGDDHECEGKKNVRHTNEVLTKGLQEMLP